MYIVSVESGDLTGHRLHDLIEEDAHVDEEGPPAAAVRGDTRDAGVVLAGCHCRCLIRVEHAIQSQTGGLPALVLRCDADHLEIQHRYR